MGVTSDGKPLPLTASAVFVKCNQGGEALKWLPAHFNVEDKLSRSSVSLRKTGAFIYALSADETSPVFVVFPDHKYSLFSCSFKSSSMTRVLQRFHSNADRAYNTLDFASKIVCQQGCFSPLLETQSQGIASLWTPAYFPRKWYPNCKNAV